MPAPAGAAAEPANSPLAAVAPVAPVPAVAGVAAEPANSPLAESEEEDFALASLLIVNGY